MLYRKMKKAAPGLSILGFGCMRLPLKENGQIDEEVATGMLRYAIDHGVNYVDTAYPYHNGESEPFRRAGTRRRVPRKGAPRDQASELADQVTGGHGPVSR